MSSLEFQIETFSERFENLARSLGFEKIPVWGTGSDEISMWRRPNADTGPIHRVYVSSGIHGDEPAGPLALLELLESAPLSQSFEWFLAPMLNPSGLRLGTRANAEGIDLNRDFLRLRSPETQALTRWWAAHRNGCDLHFSLHEDWECQGFYFYAINSSPLPCFSLPLQESLEQVLPLQTQGPVDEHELLKPGLIAHACEADEPTGWPEAIWLAKRFPVLSYTFEAPSSLPMPERVHGLTLCVQIALALIRRGALESRKSPPQ